MKAALIISIFIIFILLGVIGIGSTELWKENHFKQIEINYLREQIKAEKDSMTSVLLETRDSLKTSLAEKQLLKAEKEKALAVSEREIKKLKGIVFIQHTDSTRIAELKKLYPSFKP